MPHSVIEVSEEFGQSREVWLSVRERSLEPHILKLVSELSLATVKGSADPVNSEFPHIPRLTIL